MRVIEAFTESVSAVAVSPDGRWLAASDTGLGLAVWNWQTAEEIYRPAGSIAPARLAFSPDGEWLGTCGAGYVAVWRTTDRQSGASGALFSNGLAFSPDGKHFVATRTGGDGEPGRLVRWAVPSWQEVTGFDHWPAFDRLAFSPDGQHIAGINRERFQLRYAASGGRNGERPAVLPAVERYGSRFVRRPGDRPPGAARFPAATFARDSGTVVFGWGEELFVMDTSNGNVVREVRPIDPKVPVRDAAFTGSGRHLATADAAGVVRLWEPGSWRVAAEYDWGCGPLTCLAFTADGLAGVCGTESGQLVLFDLEG